MSEEKKVEKIVTGTVKTKKKNELKKFTDVFISEDSGKVKSYILFDVLVPAVKKAISDIITNGIDMILYGETSKSRRTSNGRISYNDFHKREEDRFRQSTQPRSPAEYDDIILSSRREAEAVLISMNELIDTYGVVSVADLYDMVGISGYFTGHKYGWINISSAKVVSVSDGYLLKLPKACPIT